MVSDGEYQGKRSNNQSEYGSGKRRNRGEDSSRGDRMVINAEDTVYRYLCPGRKIGSVIGRGGEIVKQLRAETKSRIRIGDSVHGCDERVVTICSPREESNTSDDYGGSICPALDALLKIHGRIVEDEPPPPANQEEEEEEEEDEGFDEERQFVARLLVPSDQIGAVIGKGGQIIMDIRNDTGANIRIMKDQNLPACAFNNDELVQIMGAIADVKKALFKIATRLHENPSKMQHLLGSSVPMTYSSPGPYSGPPLMGMAPMTGGGYRGGDWQGSFYPMPVSDGPPKELLVRFVCPLGNVPSLIGKNGSSINQIRHESKAAIKVDSSSADGDDCLITVTAREFFQDMSPTMEAAVRLQPKCSERTERDSGLIHYTTRLLVPASRIGCLLGKGGSIITEIRRMSKANIRILPNEDLPKVAAKDDELVQISGDAEVSRDALVQIITRLRLNVFDKEGAGFVPMVPFVPHDTKYDGRDGRRQGGNSYGDGYGGGADGMAPSDSYGSYGGGGGGGGQGYGGAYSDYSSGRGGGGSGYSEHGQRRKSGY